MTESNLAILSRPVRLMLTLYFDLSMYPKCSNEIVLHTWNHRKLPQHLQNYPVEPFLSLSIKDNNVIYDLSFCKDQTSGSTKLDILQSQVGICKKCIMAYYDVVEPEY